MSIREILYPTDLSGSDLHAGSFAACLARHLRASLHVLHVPVLSLCLPFAPLTQHVCTKLSEEWENKVGSLVERKEFRALNVRTTLGGVSIRDAIVEAAGMSDLVVMGTHARGGLLRLILGSVAEGVIGMVSSPVIVVKQPRGEGGSHSGNISGDDTGDHHLRRILVPLDGSALSESIIPIAMEIARSSEMSITLLRVITPDQSLSAGQPSESENIRWAEANAYLLFKQQMLATEGLNSEAVIRVGDIAEEILKCAEEGIDLVALRVREGRGRGSSLRGVPRRILRECTIPVLYCRKWACA